MPKSTKKKKDKAADFSKAKLKLGKGKQTPSNAIDTTFKARSIALPSQSITRNGDVNAPSTRRRLTFEDLLTHLKHYNPGTRRDAFFGLKELFEDHIDLILPSLTPLLNGCVRLIADEDASVRKSLLTFFGWLFSRVSPENLLPHASVILLFTTSAQTHIFPEIRIDAVRFLDLLLQYMPTVMVEGWARNSGGHGGRVLEGYLGILNAGTAFGEGGDTGPVRATSTASVVLSPASKLVVLRSLSVFLSTAISLRSARYINGSQTSLSQQPTPSWFFTSFFRSRVAFDSFDRLIEPVSPKISRGHQNVRQWFFDAEGSEETFVDSSAWAVERIESCIGFRDIADVGPVLDDAEASPGSMTELAYITQIARTLQSILVSTFLDYAPSVFSPNSVPPETDLQLVVSVVEIARVLYGSISSNSLGTTKDRASLLHGLNGLLGHMSIYFPFTLHWPHNSKRDIKVEEAFQTLNLAFCELVSLLMLNIPREPENSLSSKADAVQSPSERASAMSERIKPFHVDRVREYVLGALRGETSVTSSTQPTLSRPISPSAYTALLPSVWALLSNGEPEHCESYETLLAALVDHSIKVSSSSSVKRHTVDFLGRITMLGVTAETLRIPKVLSRFEPQKKLQDWLLHLPRTLWELGGSDPSTTETIFRLLLRLSQRRSTLLDETASTSLRSRLVPYFTIHHPTRGKLPGPYKKLSPSLRALALDVMFTLATPGRHEELDAAIREVVTEQEEHYWRSLWNPTYIIPCPEPTQ